MDARRWHLLALLLLFIPGCGTQGFPRVVYLARHGQTEWNRVNRWQGDPDLDQVGYLNRVSLWQVLRDKPIGAIYTSERLRTRRTADLVARQHGLEPRARAALNEIDSGIAEGICYAQMAPGLASATDQECVVPPRGPRPEAALKVVQSAFNQMSKRRLDGKMPLGESYLDVKSRTAGFLRELARGYTRRQVLVVGHGVVNRVLLHHLMGWSLDQVALLRQANDQIYRFSFKGDGKPALSLYTPGVGWTRCTQPPAPGDRFLDCNPARDDAAAEPKREQPAPELPASPGGEAVPTPAASGAGEHPEPDASPLQPPPAPETH